MSGKSKDDSYLKNSKIDKEFDYLNTVIKQSRKWDSIDILNDLIERCRKTKSPKMAEMGTIFETLLRKYVECKECYYYNGIPRGNYKITGNPFDKLLTSKQEKLVKEYISPELFKKMTVELRTLGKYLKGACTIEDMTVYRGIPYEVLRSLMGSVRISFPDLGRFLKGEEKGAVKRARLDELKHALEEVESRNPITREKSFMSTSEKRYVTWGFGIVRLDITVPKGTKGGLKCNTILTHNKYAEEVEVLFPQGTQLKWKRGGFTNFFNLSQFLYFDIEVV